MIKAVIFDVGGVLVDEPFAGMTAYYADHLGVAKDKFLQVYSEVVDDWQEGRIDENEFWKRICSHLNCGLPKNKTLWISGFKSVYHEKTKIFELIKKLKAKGFKLGLLSNTEPPNAQFMEEEYKDLFDVFVFSCETGLAKPGREIYEETLKRLGVQLNEAIFIDDKPKNVEGAQKVGIKGILFETEEQAEEEVSKLLD